jgi:hypothetical protein
MLRMRKRVLARRYNEESLMRCRCLRRQVRLHSKRCLRKGTARKTGCCVVGVVGVVDVGAGAWGYPNPVRRSLPSRNNFPKHREAWKAILPLRKWREVPRPRFSPGRKRRMARRRGSMGSVVAVVVVVEAGVARCR